MDKKTIDDIFKYLIKWRNFPKYQLERRIDLFIAFYLPEILQKNVEELKNIKINMDDIYPEFPLKKDKENDCSSDNVDFAVFVKEVKTMYLVELKTDMNSINVTQLEYYKKAKKKNIETILNGILQIENKSHQWRKYDVLLDKLIYNEENKCPIQNRKWKSDKMKIKEDKKNIDFQNKIAQYNNIKIIYIIPNDIETIKDVKIKERYKELKPLTITFDKIKNDLNIDKSDEIGNNLINLLKIISEEQNLI